MRLVNICPGLMLLLIVSACKTSSQNETGPVNPTRTPVTMTHIKTGPVIDAVELTAVSSFIYKTSVKSYVNGYIHRVSVATGEKVTKGEELFLIRTKEAEHLGQALEKIDSSAHISGLIRITAPSSGYITQLVFGTDDYVQDGEVLAVINDISKLVFLLELPYELHNYLYLNKKIKITLPDGVSFMGNLSSPLPYVDPESQTQQFMIAIPPGIEIPENLIARVQFVKRRLPAAILLPKEAVLTDEAQDKFWVMKMIDSVTAIKVPIKKGLQINDTIEILSPQFTDEDRILLTGNYGLPDTAKVIMEK